MVFMMYPKETIKLPYFSIVILQCDSLLMKKERHEIKHVVIESVQL